MVGETAAGDGLLIFRLSEYGQLAEVAGCYRRGEPVAVRVEDEELARRAVDVLSGLGLFESGDVRKIALRWWLLRPPERRLTPAELRRLASEVGSSQGLDDL